MGRQKQAWYQDSMLLSAQGKKTQSREGLVSMGKTESKKAAILFSFTLVFCGLSVPFF
jgi:hypothetical protein